MVYVDPAIWKKRGDKRWWCHMVADTPNELREFAASLGLKLCWIENEGTYKEHFDLTIFMRNKALEAGAKSITIREIGDMLVKRRENAKRG